MNRPLRISLLVAAGVVVLSVAAVGIALATLDPNSLKPRVADVIRKATGRDLTIGGDIRLYPSLWPTVEVSDVRLSNPPGFSRPQMAVLRQMRVSLALLPLLAREMHIDTLTLVQPDILLERNATGEENWWFEPQATRVSAGSAAQRAPAPGQRRLLIGAETVAIENGTLGYRDDSTGAVTTLAVTNLKATAASPGSPLHVDATATYNGMPLTIAADTGSLARLQNQQDTTPWPVKLVLGLASAHVALAGTITRPLQGKGYEVSVKASVPDTTALAPLLPGVTMPAVHDVSLAFTAVDTGQVLPVLKALSLRSGAADLGNGLTVGKAELVAPATNQPVRLAVAGGLNGTPLVATGTIGSPLLREVPFDLTLRIGDDPMQVKGKALPAAGGFRTGVALQGLMVSSKSSDLAAELTFMLEPKPSVTGTISASRIDADSLLALLDRLNGRTHPSETPPSGSPASLLADRPTRSGRIFPDTKLPFDGLRAADADLRLAIASLIVAGHEDKAIEAHIVLNESKLAIDPLKGDLPQGPMEGAIAVNATGTVPSVHVRLHAPGLALRPLLQALGQPPVLTGTVEVYADLGGTGDTPHLIASTLSGSLGVAMPSGTIDNRLFGSILGPELNTINLLDLVGRGGSSELRCFAMRLDANQGIASFRALDLSSSVATVTGSGTMNLGSETLDMTLRPEVRVAGAMVVIPVSLTGPIRKPAARVNEIKSLVSNAGSVAGKVIGNGTPLGVVGGLLGAGKITAGGDACPAALATARGQAVPVAAERSGAARATEGLQKLPIPNLSDPAKGLRNLFR